jgi:hypothetical protein
MIDRRTTLVSAALITLMLVAAAWRIITLDDWTTFTIQNGGNLPSLLLVVFPACSALVVGALYWDVPGATGEEAKLQPWSNWGRSLSIGYCGGMLLLQGVLIVGSLGHAMPFDLSAISRGLGLLLAIMCLLAINRIPKLPWFERRVAPGGNLGPIYGPRYMRIQSWVLVAFMIAVTAYSLMAPRIAMGWRAAGYILLAASLLVVWSVMWRVHLGRKWKLEQVTAGSAKP